MFALSGRLAGPIPKQTDWPPITLLHGQVHPVIPVQVAKATDASLYAAGATPNLQVFEALAHGLDNRVNSGLVDQIY